MLHCHPNTGLLNHESQKVTNLFIKKRTTREGQLQEGNLSGKMKGVIRVITDIYNNTYTCILDNRIDGNRKKTVNEQITKSLLWSKI